MKPARHLFPQVLSSNSISIDIVLIKIRDMTKVMSLFSFSVPSISNFYVASDVFSEIKPVILHFNVIKFCTYRSLCETQIYS